ncbi:MAG: hypothetical protein AAFP28_06900 [Pseudomonadota bacterium]
MGVVAFASAKGLGAAGVLDTEASVAAAASFWSRAKDWVTFVCTIGASEDAGAFAAACCSVAVAGAAEAAGAL